MENPHEHQNVPRDSPSSRGGGRGGGGHTLGGGSSSSGSPVLLSPEELRRRRLTALAATTTTATDSTSSGGLVVAVHDHHGGRGSPSSVTTATTNTPTTTQIQHQQQQHLQLPRTTAATTAMDDEQQKHKTKKTLRFFDEDDEDAELQAALALSLSQHYSSSSTTAEQQEQETQRTTGKHLSNNANASSSLARSPDDNDNDDTMDVDHDNNETSISAAAAAAAAAVYAACWAPFPAQDVKAFHALMWDDSLTTQNDQSRWVGQGIHVRKVASSVEVANAEQEKEPTSDGTATTIATSTTTTDENNNNNNENENETMLEALAQSHLPWGLLQQYGGPCGVLAAVQAEMLKCMLWTKSHRSCENNNNNNDTMRAVAAEAVSPDRVRMQTQTALARSIAIILARAALTPSAVAASKEQDEEEKTNDIMQSEGSSSSNKETVTIVLPARRQEDGGDNDNDEAPSVIWQDLEPWSTNTRDEETTNDNNNNSKLVAYTVGLLPEAAATSATTTISGPKRQRIHSGGVHNESSSTTSSLEDRIERLADAVTAFLLDSTAVVPLEHRPQKQQHQALLPLDSFQRRGGVMLLVMSLVASRGSQTIQSEFDDDNGSKLTSQFGHCAQELINLLLTGQAVSNVFDNTLKPSGDMVCRGIQSRPSIGYLSQLESLRYCQVGEYYKSPKFPIWVVGSTSHFTVLFGEISALHESESDKLLSKCRRAFKAVEGGEENGFIAVDQLSAVLKSLDLDVGGDSAVQTLAASMEVSGAGIILWDDFWKATSRLMTGASVETVLGSADNVPIVVDGDEPPPLLEQSNSNGEATDAVAAFDSAPQSAATAAAASPHDDGLSDEELARRIAAELNGINANDDDTKGGLSALTAAARVASPMEIDTSVMSDEELARKLQAEWDAEVSGSAASVAAVNGSPGPLFSDLDDNDNSRALALPPTPPPTNRCTVEEDSKPAAMDLSSSGSVTHKQKQEFEQYGNTFTLYHYNGLRGGALTPFRVTRLSADEAVGSSIALNRGNSGSSHGGGGRSGDLEDVVRTKWPSCMINWLGKSPPYID